MQAIIPKYLLRYCFKLALPGWYGRSALNKSFELGPTSAGLQLFPDLQHDTESKYLETCLPN